MVKTKQNLTLFEEIELRVNEVERIRKYEIETCQNEMAELGERVQLIVEDFQKRSRYSEANNVASGGARVSVFYLGNGIG